MPTFAFPAAPVYLTVRIRRNWNAPLPIDNFCCLYHSFGGMFDARLLSTPDRSTSELLRTL